MTARGPLTKHETLVVRPHNTFTIVTYVGAAAAIAIGAVIYGYAALALVALAPLAFAIAMAVRRIEFRVVDDIVTISWHGYLTQRASESLPRSSITNVHVDKVAGDPRSLTLMTTQGDLQLTSPLESGDLELAVFRIGHFLEL